MIAVGPLAAVREWPLLPSRGIQYPCRHFAAARYFHVIDKGDVGWGPGVITVRANIIKIQMVAQVVIFKKQIPVRNATSHVRAVRHDVRRQAEFFKERRLSNRGRNLRIPADCSERHFHAPSRNGCRHPYKRCCLLRTAVYIAPRSRR